MATQTVSSEQVTPPKQVLAEGLWAIGFRFVVLYCGPCGLLAQILTSLIPI